MSWYRGCTFFEAFLDDLNSFFMELQIFGTTVTVPVNVVYVHMGTSDCFPIKKSYRIQVPKNFAIMEIVFFRCSPCVES